VNATQQAQNDPATARLGRAVDRLVAQVAHWEPARWTVGGGPDGVGTRADRVLALVQRLADRCAEVEGRAPVVVPRLGELVLADQLRVIAHDLGAAGGATDDVADDVDAVRRTL
jgi:hypothetical protein